VRQPVAFNPVSFKELRNSRPHCCTNIESSHEAGTKEKEAANAAVELHLPAVSKQGIDG
jgi:hypothetical protein